MNILLTGATGLIGSAVLARLRQDGHKVIAVTHRRPAPNRDDAVRWIHLDIAKAVRAEDWLPHLTGIDAAVNCAGIFEDTASDSSASVNATGPAALFAACERAGVRRVIHLSAIGVEREALTPFSRNKRKAEEDLMARDLDWIVLRPSMVLGRAAYGGSALIRGLACLPILPKLPDTGPLQIVQLDDLVQTVAAFLPATAPSRKQLDIAGLERLSLIDVVALYRAWLGCRPARVVQLPSWAAAGLYRLGDAVALLGWRTPLRSTARRELVRGAIGDPTEWIRLTGIVPRRLAEALSAEPASVQERWFAPLYMLKPLVFGTFAVFWIATGLLSLGPGYAIGVCLMREAGAGSFSGASVVAGALGDILIGMGIAIRRTAPMALIGALALTGLYAAMGSILLPRLWIDPLGPVLKIWPIVMLNLVALAIVKDR